MSEKEIIETFKHWIEYEKANKDKINKVDELIEIQQGLLDLYQKEKEKNKKYQGIENGTTIIYKSKAKYVREDRIEKYYINKNKIRERIKELEQIIEFEKPTYEDEIKYTIEILKELLEDE